MDVLTWRVVDPEGRVAESGVTDVKDARLMALGYNMAILEDEPAPVWATDVHTWERRESVPGWVLRTPENALVLGRWENCGGGLIRSLSRAEGPWVATRLELVDVHGRWMESPLEISYRGGNLGVAGSDLEAFHALAKIIMVATRVVLGEQIKPLTKRALRDGLRRAVGAA